MNGHTVATLHELYNATWFSRVGVRDTRAARVLDSWDEAFESCASPDWEELTQEAVNRLCEQLARRSPERFRRWNDVARDVKPTVEELVRVKTSDLVESLRAPRVFLDVVRFDVLNLCMESEFADVYAPAFFAAQAYWYVAGHFPCGWDGNFPDGSLVVY